MAGATPLDDFFAIVRAQGFAVVPEQPKFDLESYIQNYRRHSRFDRLLLIGQRSQPLCIDALKAAHAEAKSGKDVSRYRDVWNCLRIAAPNEPEAVFDKAWVEAKDAENKAETKRLERELKGYKNNLVKESIRMANEELGKHLEATGDTLNAVDAYNRMRPDVSTPKHIVDVGKHLVRLAVERTEWSTALGHLNKITGLQGTDEEKAMLPYLRSMTGLCLLGQEQYAAAATQFLEIQSSSSESITAATDGMVSSNDVAVYGGLLALATMNRKELRDRVLENSSFRPFLELEPQIRRAVSQFANGRYAACLAILASYKPDYLLDLYLHTHVDAIYAQIRSKCITQYLIPFSCVTLDSLNATFAAPGETVDDELATMIREGVLDARINLVDRLLTIVKEDPRIKMQKNSLEAFSTYEKEALDRLRRMSIVAADLEVKGTRKGISGITDINDDWRSEVSHID